MRTEEVADGTTDTSSRDLVSDGGVWGLISVGASVMELWHSLSFHLVIFRIIIHNVSI